MRISRDGNRCPSLSVSSSRHNLCTFRSSQPLPPKLSPHLTPIVDSELFFKNLNSSLFLTVKSQPSDSVKPDFPIYTFPMCISKEEKSFHFFKTNK